MKQIRDLRNLKIVISTLKTRIMKTISNRIITNNRLAIISIILLIGVTVLSCSKDDNGDSIATINAKTQTFTVNGINNCNTSSGSGSTFFFDIPYTTSTSSKIKQLQIKTIVSDGGSDSAINTKFTDENSTISWATCFRFGSQSWVEFEVVLEAQDGSKSNPTKVRVNKPNGAD